MPAVPHTYILAGCQQSWHGLNSNPCILQQSPVTLLAFQQPHDKVTDGHSDPVPQQLHCDAAPNISSAGPLQRSSEAHASSLQVFLFVKSVHMLEYFAEQVVVQVE
jgi:hypothetical protein